MKSARKRPTAAKLRSWRVSIIRKRGQYLGTVEAPNEKAAEAAAVAELEIRRGVVRRLTTATVQAPPLRRSPSKQPAVLCWEDRPRPRREGGEKPAAEAGALMAYAVDRYDLWFRAAFFVDKILKGTQPADLPIDQAAKFELVINLKTAKALGLEVPTSILLRATEVIE
jgi:ABC transporter substrate binding protein